MSSSNAGTFIDGIFMTILFGNVLLILMLSPFVNSPLSIEEIPGSTILKVTSFQFTPFDFTLGAISSIVIETGQFLYLMISSLFDVFLIPVQFFIATISVYSQLGLFGSIILGLNAIIGLFWVFEHIEGIIGIFSSFIQAIGSLIPFT